MERTQMTKLRLLALLCCAGIIYSLQAAPVFGLEAVDKTEVFENLTSNEVEFLPEEKDGLKRASVRFEVTGYDEDGLPSSYRAIVVYKGYTTATKPPAAGSDAGQATSSGSTASGGTNGSANASPRPAQGIVENSSVSGAPAASLPGPGESLTIRPEETPLTAPPAEVGSEGYGDANSSPQLLEEGVAKITSAFSGKMTNGNSTAGAFGNLSSFFPNTDTMMTLGLVLMCAILLSLLLLLAYSRRRMKKLNGKNGRRNKGFDL